MHCLIFCCMSRILWDDDKVYIVVADAIDHIRKIVKYCTSYRPGYPMGSYVLHLFLGGICLLK